MKDVAKFLLEAGTLKRIRRAWFKAEGVPNPESVADHSHRTAMLGYILADLEGADASKVMKMCLFHDVPETRIGDLDKIAQRYINKDDAEWKAFEDQTKNLPESIRKEILPVLKEFFDKKTKEAVVARDADILEMLIQAKEYADTGYKGCLYWVEKGEKLLRTESAKSILKEVMSVHSTDWWKGLESLR